MRRLAVRELALLREADEKGLLVIRVYQARDLILSEKRRNDLAENLRVEGYLRCRARLGQKRNVLGDAWAEYTLSESGEALVASCRGLPPQRSFWSVLPFLDRPAGA